VSANSFIRAGLVLLVLYLSAIGATWNGVLLPSVSFITLAVAAILAAVWLVSHWRGGWIWHTSPLDLVGLAWGAAFVLSILANGDDWRRGFIALWYIGLYAGVWFALRDLLDNRALTRATLIDTFLIGSLGVVFFGYFQITRTDFDLLALDFPRPGSVIGNPNSLGAYLVVLLAFAISRLTGVRSGIGRLTLGMYTLLIGVLLLATFSRGAWLGGLAALATITALSVPLNRPRAWMAEHRRTVIGVGIAGGLITALIGGLVIASLSQSGRQIGLRTEIWDAAMNTFTAQPLTGHGLFTFGPAFAEQQSQPPNQPHSHAHNAPLHIAAELGLPGLIALALTAATLLIAMRRAYFALSARERPTLTAGIAAAIGFGVHHLVDLPAMMPLIALIGVLAIAIATTPAQPAPMQVRWRKLGHPAGMVTLWIVLIGSGLWSTNVYSGYYDALSAPFGDNGDRDYRAAAERIDAAITADPDLAYYHFTQGYLYALAADSGDESALPLAIASFTAYLERDRKDAIAWMNLAALHRENNADTDALNALVEAVAAAPASWPSWVNYGIYLEDVGFIEQAQSAYIVALETSSSVPYHPLWDETDLRQSVAARYDRAPIHQVTAALLDGSIQAQIDADILYTQSGFTARNRPENLVIRALVAIRVGDLTTAQDLLNDATTAATVQQHDAWVHLGRAALAQAEGDAATFDSQLAAARADTEFDYTTPLYRTSSNVPYFQWLRFALARQIIPQANYYVVDAALLRLLDDLE